MADLKTYRLGSAEFVSAPGLIAWAINGAAFKRDRKQMIKIVSDTWSVPAAAAKALLLKEVPYTLDGETVVFTA